MGKSRIERRQQALAKLAALPAQARSRIKQAIAESADEIVAMQKRLVPVQTGRLRDSIQQHWGNAPKLSSAGVSMKAGAGDPDLTVIITAGGGPRETGWYARFVEFGTAPHEQGGKFAGAQHPGTAARPFFYPAYRALKRRAVSRVSRATGKAAREVAART
jgi:HK97 gp10 family phage protein